MNTPKIDPMYLLTGLAALAYSVYALVAGEVLTSRLEFVAPTERAFDYYLHVIGLALVGAGLTYRSLLFVPGNREYHARPDRSQDGPYEVEPGRTAAWTLIGVAIFAVFLLLYGWLIG